MAQGCALEGLEDAAQGAAKARAAGKEVVVAPKDHRLAQDLYRQILEEAAQIRLGVGSNVGREPVAKETGQVVDERYVPKMVPATPVDAMRFEGVPAVGTEQDQPTQGAKHPHHFQHCFSIVCHVLNHLVR
jgi:hypothetical protein